MEISRYLTTRFVNLRAASGHLARKIARRAERAEETILAWLVSLTLIGPERWRCRPISIIWQQSRAPRTIGDFFPVVIFVRLLRRLQFDVKFTIVLCPTEDNKWSELTRLQRKEVVNQWIALSKLLLGESGVEVVSLKECDFEPPGDFRRFSRETSNLCHSGGVFKILEVLYRLAPRLTKPHFLCDEFKLTTSELEHFGLRRPFVTWHVRANASYATGRNLRREEIVEDFRWICANMPGFQVVLLSDADGLRVVKNILLADSSASDLVDRLVLVPQTYSFALRLIWSSSLYLQRYGGGTSMGAVWSRVPYVILSPDRWPGLPAPWATVSQLLLTTNYQRLTFADALDGGSAPFNFREAISEEIWE